MAACLDVLPFINTLPDSVLILGKERGNIIGANDVFLRHTGLTQESVRTSRLLDLPFFSRVNRRHLLRIYVKALRGVSGRETMPIQYVTPGQNLKNVIAMATRFESDGETYVTFTFREPSGPEETAVDANSWENCLKLTCEPYMEFRPVSPLVPPLELEDRLSFLTMAGDTLRVKYANAAAVDLFDREKGTLADRTFISFFKKEEDALRFLDMLSVVGQMKAETIVAVGADQVAEVEVNCVVHFDDNGGIEALYCSQRDLSSARRYEAIIGGSRVETDFTFNQPFMGVAYLVPVPHPLERPNPQNVEASLDAMLDQILITRANHAMMTLYESDRAKFMMKPMRELFPDTALARKVLKELFVIRTSSAAIYESNERDLRYVTVFRAIFDEADRLNGIMMIASKYEQGFQARYNNKPETHAPSLDLV
ncbi:MAG: PAS domain-containing protein [Synergistaceae bacterium]|jgi:PAS domain-containing protein|nr:PAS domain-containing protein [Synergistaceae bacterium]